MAKIGIIGITGGTNVGKSTIVDCLTDVFAGQITVFDADAALQHLYAQDQKVISKIKNLCPDAVINGQVDRKKLAEFYFLSDKNSEAVNNASIEEIRNAANIFAQENKEKLAIFDMPMLVEVGIDKLCDIVLLITAPYEERKERALKRMSAELFDKIVKKQSGLAKAKRDKLSAKECADLGDQSKRDALSNYIEINNPNSKSIGALSDEVAALLGELS